jgi:uncharacterized protein (DUF2252 family)
VEDPPLLTHVDDIDERWVTEVLASYRASLSDERRQLLDRYRAHDAARKVVGVGSLGTRCYVLLLLGHRHDDPLLLQVKQATSSVLARAHARSGDVAAISGYLGSSDRFDRAVVTFAEAYADQTDADYAAFTRDAAPGARDAG